MLSLKAYKPLINMYMPGILGKKVGMTRIIVDGKMTPLTVVQCQPNTILQLKTVEKDGYNAIVVGFDEMKKPTKNKKYKHLKEFKVDSLDDYKVGDLIDVSQFTDVKNCKLTAYSKGKGFQGVIKRHNFSRGPETHGSRHHREPGSVGACAAPGRVAKGKKLPGRTGYDKVTLTKAKVAYIEPELNLIGIKGPIPGAKNNLVVLSF